VGTACGDILAASSTENPDLFWGIRGAGCNFGVITEFVLRLHPQRRTAFGGIIAYPPPKIPDATSFAVNFWETGLSEKEAIYCAHTSDLAGNVHTFGIFGHPIPDTIYMTASHSICYFLEWFGGGRPLSFQAVFRSW